MAKNLPLALKHVLKLVCYGLGLLMELGFCKPTRYYTEWTRWSILAKWIQVAALQVT